MKFDLPVTITEPELMLTTLHASVGTLTTMSDMLKMDAATFAGPVAEMLDALSLQFIRVVSTCSHPKENHDGGTSHDEK